MTDTVLLRSTSVLAALALGAAACTGSGSDDAGADAAGETRTFEGDHGEVEIPAVPQRVVALSYAAQPAVELGGDVVGVHTDDNWDEKIHPDDVDTMTGLEQVGATDEINFEAVANLEPDLIVVAWPADGWENVPLDDLGEIAPTATIGLGDPDSWKEVEAQVADAVGVSDTYEDVEAEYDTRVAELGEEYAPVLEETDFAFVRSSEGTPGAGAGQVLQEFGPAWNTSIATEVGLDFIGEQNEASHQAWAAYHPLEEIDQLSGADVILTEARPDGEVPGPTADLLDQDVFESLPAAQDDQVHPLSWSDATTHKSALLTLDSLDEVLDRIDP
ncbi:ABC transporter substrate-binding protein [Nocardiopsis sp. HNM0947]|uniref:ABC transporter substrate-binding protein n=1 Tax=Nocardiopsis coralli TaxID=2772213 RepID=A0ABR9P142_9ACTN|nr:ABC transporter substrate-binding protein [Nocardiopsis coralli]MBE2997579.1 ABC transporter substrate-binding protein [Nocardiopsis coralli]